MFTCLYDFYNVVLSINIDKVSHERSLVSILFSLLSNSFAKVHGEIL